MKIDNPLYIHIAYETFNHYQPRPYQSDDSKLFVSKALKIAEGYIEKQDLQQNKNLIQCLV